MIKVLDWDKAARIIKENGYQNVEAGLGEDWSFTGGKILSGGKIVEEKQTYCWLRSCWATPVIRVYGDGEHIEHECSREAGDDYTPEYWPESARKILEEKEEI